MINESTGSVGSTPTSTALGSGTLKQGAPCALLIKLFMEKNNKNSLLIHLDMLYRDLLVVCGNETETRNALLVYHDKEVVDNLLEDFSFGKKGRTVFDPEYNAFFVWLPQKPKTAQETGFLVHELFHASYAILKNIGSDLCDESEEVFAYMLGYVTEKTIDWITSSSS